VIPTPRVGLEDDPFGLDGFVSLETDDEGKGPGLDSVEGETALLVGIGDEDGVEHVQLDGHHSRRLDLTHEVTGYRIVLEVASSLAF